METLKDFLWPIAAIGGLGAFIDFLIGRTGQERAKDFLFKWWVRFDDVRWKNFGREEGLFAGHVMEQWFGKKIWSFRRFKSAFILLILFLLISFLREIKAGEFDISCLICVGLLKDVPFSLPLSFVATSFLGFTLSISFTKYLTFRTACLCTNRTVKNIGLYVGMLLINYLFMIIWFPITSNIKLAFIKDVQLLLLPALNFDSAIELLKLDVSEVSQKILQAILVPPLYPKELIQSIAGRTSIVDIPPFNALTVFLSLFRFLYR